MTRMRWPQLGDTVLYQLNAGDLRAAVVVAVHDEHTLNLMVYPAYAQEDFKLIESVRKGTTVGSWLHRPVEVRPS